MLLLAIDKESFNKIRRLLKTEEVDSIDIMGRTPLSLAAEIGRANVI
jgi:hypothetical protein